MTIQIEIKDAQLRANLEELRSRVGNLQPAHELIGEYFMGKIERQFDEEVDPYGNKWIANSPYTIRKKRSEGKILKVLQATGQMRASANYKATSTEVSIGFSSPLAYKHQTGDGVPVRQLLGASSEDVQEIKNLIDLYIQKLL